LVPHLIWPLANVWLGVSAERQQEADERIPHLLATPAAVRFVSAEPLLSEINLTRLFVPNDGFGPRWANALNPDDWGWFADEACTLRMDKATAYGPYFASKLDWAIVGGESSSDARPMHLDWARAIVAQCQAAGVPVFVKQLGARPVFHLSSAPYPIRHKKGAAMEEWPPELRVREMPTIQAKSAETARCAHTPDMFESPAMMEGGAKTEQGGESG
jgi:hypothetical protein